MRAISRLPRAKCSTGTSSGRASPITGLVRSLGALVGGLAWRSSELHEKKESGEIPAGEAPPRADEAPADEATADAATAQPDAAGSDGAQESQAEEPAAPEPSAEPGLRGSPRLRRRPEAAPEPEAAAEPEAAKQQEADDSSSEKPEEEATDADEAETPAAEEKTEPAEAPAREQTSRRRMRTAPASRRLTRRQEPRDGAGRRQQADVSAQAESQDAETDPTGGLNNMATSTEDWIEELKGILVLELAERIKALEEEFGVSATAVAAPVARGGRRRRRGRRGRGRSGGTVDVVLAEAGDKNPGHQRCLAATGLGLKEAKAPVDEAPKPVKEGIEREEADKLKKELEEAGAGVEVK